MVEPLMLTAYLGGALLLLSGCGYFLLVNPTKETFYVTVEEEETDDEDVRDATLSARQQQRQPPPAQPPPQRADLHTQMFQEAQAKAITKLTRETPEDVRNIVYAHYSQATKGDVQGERPPYFSQRERAKWDAWAKHRGMSYADAVEGYCKVVDLL